MEEDHELEAAVEAVYEEEEEDTDIRYQISYYPADLTLEVLYQKWKNGQLIVPEWQRQFVWDQTRASRLIESFLLGLPVPGVFLYRRQDNNLLIIDGQQRITSIIQFLEGTFREKVPFRLKRVDDSWEGRTFETLTNSDKNLLRDTVLRATIIQQNNPDDDSSVFHIFERLNTGGVTLKPMEIRKCIYFGNYFRKLEELNELPEWRLILGRDEPDKHLRDVELVLRYAALREQGEQYERPMSRFLNRFMKAMHLAQTEEVEDAMDRLELQFRKATSLAVSLLGEKPFHPRGRLNLAAMDTVLPMLDQLSEPQIEKLPEAFEHLMSDEQFVQDTSKDTSDTAVVARRRQIAREYLLS